jgi:hypothetical protein
MNLLVVQIITGETLFIFKFGIGYLFENKNFVEYEKMLAQKN